MDTTLVKMNWVPTYNATADGSPWASDEFATRSWMGKHSDIVTNRLAVIQQFNLKRNQINFFFKPRVNMIKEFCAKKGFVLLAFRLKNHNWLLTGVSGGDSIDGALSDISVDLLGGVWDEGTIESFKVMFILVISNQIIVLNYSTVNAIMSKSLCWDL